MNESMKTAITAINKWFFYAMNYKVVEVEVITFLGERTMMLPDFFNAFPKSMRKHFAEKWEYGYNEYGSRAALMWFYGQISSGYRVMLIEWIMENFNDEQKIHFNTED